MLSEAEVTALHRRWRTIACAVIASLLAPRRTAAPLASIKTFMAANNAAIMMVILLLFGAKLVGEGLAALTG